MSTTETRAPRSVGQIAYEAYCDHQGWRSVRGEVLPAWANQSPDLQAAWEFAAQEVRAFVAEHFTLSIEDFKARFTEQDFRALLEGEGDAGG